MHVGHINEKDNFGKTEYHGRVESLKFDSSFFMVENKEAVNPNAPTHLIKCTTSACSDVKIGAAWLRESKGGVEFFSISIDDPSFEHPLNVAAFRSKDDPKKWDITWRRRQAA
jgi:uncharacterized protein (DUF736 family)